MFSVHLKQPSNLVEQLQIQKRKIHTIIQTGMNDKHQDWEENISRVREIKQYKRCEEKSKDTKTYLDPEAKKYPFMSNIMLGKYDHQHTASETIVSSNKQTRQFKTVTSKSMNHQQMQGSEVTRRCQSSCLSSSGKCRETFRSTCIVSLTYFRWEIHIKK